MSHESNSPVSMDDVARYFDVPLSLLQPAAPSALSNAEMIAALTEVHSWARDLPIPTPGTISAMQKVRAVRDALAAAPVAAQAGQVAVPEDVARDAARFRWLEERFTGFDFYWMGTPPYEAEEDKGKCVIVFECGQDFEAGRHFQREIDKKIGLTATPSPAKESK